MRSVSGRIAEQRLSPCKGRSANSRCSGEGGSKGLHSAAPLRSPIHPSATSAIGAESCYTRRPLLARPRQAMRHRFNAGAHLTAAVEQLGVTGLAQDPSAEPTDAGPSAEPGAAEPELEGAKPHGLNTPRSSPQLSQARSRAQRGLWPRRSVQEGGRASPGNPPPPDKIATLVVARGAAAATETQAELAKARGHCPRRRFASQQLRSCRPPPATQGVGARAPARHCGRRPDCAQGQSAQRQATPPSGYRREQHRSRLGPAPGSTPAASACIGTPTAAPQRTAREIGYSARFACPRDQRRASPRLTKALSKHGRVLRLVQPLRRPGPAREPRLPVWLPRNTFPPTQQRGVFFFCPRFGVPRAPSAAQASRTPDLSARRPRLAQRAGRLSACKGGPRPVRPGSPGPPPGKTPIPCHHVGESRPGRRLRPGGRAMGRWTARSIT